MMPSDTKKVSFQAKAVRAAERVFEGLLSTWETDLGGDVIHRGAFKDWLNEWKNSGAVLPLIDNHQYRSVRNVVGKLLDAKETKDGLWTQWQVIRGEDGDEILHRIEDGIIDGLSIGYQPMKSREPSDRDRERGIMRHLEEVALREGSVVIWPMNTGARISAVKAALEETDPLELNDENRKELRLLASRIGHLLRPSPPADAADATDPEDEPEPEAPPEKAAAQTAEPAEVEEEASDDTYLYVEALHQRLLRVKTHAALGGK